MDGPTDVTPPRAEPVRPVVVTVAVVLWLAIGVLMAVTSATR